MIGRNRNFLENIWHFWL